MLLTLTSPSAMAQQSPHRFPVAIIRCCTLPTRQKSSSLLRCFAWPSPLHIQWLCGLLEPDHSTFDALLLPTIAALPPYVSMLQLPISSALHSITALTAHLLASPPIESAVWHSNGEQRHKKPVKQPAAKPTARRTMKVDTTPPVAASSRPPSAKEAHSLYLLL